MKRKQILIFCLVGFAFVSLFGALSHFFYEWSGKNPLAGVFFAANESTWEHLKLAIFPTIVYFLAGLFFLKGKNGIVAFFVTLITPMLLIPAIFYSYTAVTGEPVLAVDIATYFIGVAAAFALCGAILSVRDLPKWCSILSCAGIAAIIVCYLTFTLYPPDNFLFRDGVTGGYGLGR